MDGCNTIIALNYRRLKLLPLVDVMGAGERLSLEGVAIATEKRINENSYKFWL
jgi:hypothetical protein